MELLFVEFLHLVVLLRLETFITTRVENFFSFPLATHGQVTSCALILEGHFRLLLCHDLIIESFFEGAAVAMSLLV